MKGCTHIYCGDGKGKTTAAMGLVLRAAGSGLDVLMFQFLKDNSSSERVILEQIPNVTCLPGKDRVKFVSKMNADEKARYCSSSPILPYYAENQIRPLHGI